MSTKSTNVLLAAAVMATTILASAAPVSATPVWLPGKVRGEPHREIEKSPEAQQADREQLLLLRQQQVQQRGQARADQGRSSGPVWMK